MLQGIFLVIDVDMSFLVILILFITSIVLLVKVNKEPGNRIPFAVLTMSIAIFILFGLNFYHFLVDDVYISLRYARNLANGYGLVFSTDGSQPVEGYTNFLWVLMEALLFLLGFSDQNILHILRISGILFGAGVVLVIYNLMRILKFTERTSLTAILFLCVFPEFSFWAVGGLETALYMLLLLLAIYRYIYERKTSQYHVWSIFFLLLLALTRPEGLFIAAVLIGCHFLQAIFLKDKLATKQSLIRILPGIILFVVLYGAYFFWRFNMYGYVFPNTFYAKKMTNFEQLINRSKEVSQFFGPLLPFFAVACIGYFQLQKKIAYEKLLLLAILVTLILFCYLARCEWMPGHRYELPIVPVLMIFFAAGIDDISYSAIRRFNTNRYKKIIPFCFILFFGGFLMSRFNDLRKTGNEFAKQLNRAHVPFGKWLRLHAPANASYASWDMGAVPYFSGLHTIIDINSEGLLNPQTTHKGYNIDGLLSLKPSFLVLPPNTSYVRPKDILSFYSNPKLQQNYEYLFAVAFNRDYILHVYKHKDVMLTELAVEQAHNIAKESKGDLLD